MNTDLRTHFPFYTRDKLQSCFFIFSASPSRLNDDVPELDEQGALDLGS